MSTRERRREQEPRRDVTAPGGGGGNGGGNAELDALLGEAGELLRAADETISNVLTSDSEDFIRQARQESGQ
jgi:hypothetical protein